MIYLVYVSTATTLLSDEELGDILHVSRRNNEAADITGMLLYRNGNFIQTLEGPPQAVRETYERIFRDPRHKSVIKILERPTEVRNFAGWSMGFRNADKLSGEDKKAINVFLSEPSDPKTADARGGLVYKLLLNFRDAVSG